MTARANPATKAASITPADAGTHQYRSLFIGGAGSGNLKVTTEDGNVVAFAGVPIGFFPVAVSRVWSTGTDVTDIVGLN